MSIASPAIISGKLYSPSRVTYPQSPTSDAPAALISSCVATNAILAASRSAQCVLGRFLNDAQHPQLATWPAERLGVLADDRPEQLRMAVQERPDPTHVDADRDLRRDAEGMLP